MLRIHSICLLLVVAVVAGSGCHKKPKPDPAPPPEIGALPQPTPDGFVVEGTLIVTEDHDGMHLALGTSLGKLPVSELCTAPPASTPKADGKKGTMSNKGKMGKKFPAPAGGVAEQRAVALFRFDKIEAGGQRVSMELLMRLLQTGEAAPNDRLSQAQAPPTPNDPRFEDQWSLENTGPKSWEKPTPMPRPPDIDVNAPEAWKVTKGKADVFVAVVDSGIGYAPVACTTKPVIGDHDCIHRDLRDNVWINRGECPSGGSSCDDGKDNDGNGYVDDVHGIDSIEVAKQIEKGMPAPYEAGTVRDENGHGTAVAGVIGATTDNKLDIAGIGWKGGVLPCKFLDRFGEGTTCDAIRCLDYVANVKRDQKPEIAAVNNSWGGGQYNPVLQKVIERLGDKDYRIPVIAAAGNSSNDLDAVGAFYPASYANVLSVAATDWYDYLWSASNYGGYVLMAAPGYDIRTLRPPDVTECRWGGGCDYVPYTMKSGTSMAAAAVSGVASLLWADDIAKGNAAADRQVRVRNLLLAGGVDAAVGKTVTSRRLRAWDKPGAGPGTRGSLTCQDQVVQSPRSPVKIGPSKFLIEVISIRCGKPEPLPASYMVEVAKSLGGPTVLSPTAPRDDGNGGDAHAGDGVFTVSFATSIKGKYTTSADGKLVHDTLLDP